MMNVSLEQLAKVLAVPGRDLRQVSTILQFPETALGAREITVLALAQILQRTSCLTYPAGLTVLRLVSEALDNRPKVWDVTPTVPVEDFVLVVAQGRYASWDEGNQVYDTERHEFMATLPGPVAWAVSYRLAVLFFQTKILLQEAARVQNCDQKDPGGS
jgi:hypothetical protein